MKNKYDESHIAEIYDQVENKSEDINLIKELVKENRVSKILEPFCGTGRILIPLAEEGFAITGIDQSQSMLDRIYKKIDKELLSKINLIHADILNTKWPNDFDVVVLGSNSFYELANDCEQKLCIEKAYESLRQGGFLYIENDNMEGELEKSWQTTKIYKNWFPSGTCKDGTKLKTTVELISFNVKKGLWKAKRTTNITYPGGESKTITQITQTHPSSAIDIEHWLRENNFKIIFKYSSVAKKPYYPNCKRAIFWAQKM